MKTQSKRAVAGSLSLVVGAALAMLYWWGGGANEPGTQREGQALEVNRLPTSALRNLADVKCLDDGFRLETVHRNGIPVYALCIDHASQSKCESWAYFRGECPLPQPASSETEQ
ncbi:MAG: hypothetical protein OXH37_01165 [Gammaproteobacteria bacterium]|nr:hypothetical protein [Gammaproteobacteria bacterium]